MTNMTAIANLLAGAESIEDIQAVVDACGGVLDNKVVQDIILRSIKANPALNAKMNQAKNHSRIGRQLRKEVKEEAMENLSFNKYDLVRLLSKAPGECSGGSALATGRKLPQAKVKLHTEKMRNVGTSLLRYREGLSKEGLIAEGSGTVYIISFNRDGKTFCKVGLSYDMNRREADLRKDYGSKLEIVRTFHTAEPHKLETMLKDRFIFARTQVQQHYSHIIRSTLTGHTEVMLGQHLREVVAKAEALYLFLS